MSNETIKRDAAAFGPRQYYVEGYIGPMFSTKSDAEDALRLVAMIKMEMKLELAEKLKDILP